MWNVCSRAFSISSSALRTGINFVRISAYQRSQELLCQKNCLKRESNERIALVLSFYRSIVTRSIRSMLPLNVKLFVLNGVARQ